MNRVFNVATSGMVVVSFFVFSGPAIAGPKLICEEPSYNFGEKEEGESVEHTFIIKNVGDEPAEMKKAKPQCGCMAVNVADAKNDTVAPGAEAPITVKLPLGHQRGQVRKGVTIPPGNGNQEPIKLMVEGAVTSTLAVVPEKIVLGQVEADKEATRSAIVAFALKEPVTIMKCTSETNTVVPTVETIKDGGVYRLTVRVKPPQGTSSIQTQVTLLTDSKTHAVINIPVIGTVLGDLVATPDELVLAGSATEPVTRYIMIESPKNKPFEIQDVQCPTASVKAEVRSMGPAKYRIEISGLAATSDLDGKALVVKTSVSSVPTIEIPLHVSRPVVDRTERQMPVPPQNSSVSVTPKT